MYKFSPRRQAEHDFKMKANTGLRDINTDESREIKEGETILNTN